MRYFCDRFCIHLAHQSASNQVILELLVVHFVERVADVARKYLYSVGGVFV